MSFFEKFTGPKLQSTDVGTFSALEAKVREIANQAGPEGSAVTDKDIKQAAFHLALKQERAGTPYTAERIANISEDEKAAFAGALGVRMQSRPEETTAMHVSDQHGEVLGTANTKKEVMDMTEVERASM